MPHAAAATFSKTGRPMARHASTAACGVVSSGVPGSTGKPTLSARARAVCFRANELIVSAVGPMNTMPACVQCAPRAHQDKRGWDPEGFVLKTDRAKQ